MDYSSRSAPEEGTVGPAVLSGPHTRTNVRNGAVGTPRPTFRTAGPAVLSGPHTRSNAKTARWDSRALPHRSAVRPVAQAVSAAEPP